MKKNIVCLSIFILISLTGKSQFIIDSTYNPVPGDSIKLIECDSSGIFPGGSGPDQVWDFSGVVSGTNEFYEAFCLPSETPPEYSNQYSESNLATVNNNVPPIYHYYETTDSAWLLHGYIYPGFKIKYQKPNCRLTYPLAYGLEKRMNYHGIITVPGATGTQDGSRSFTVDGHGTLILPEGNWTNAMRIKTTDTISDTIRVNGTVIQTSTTVILNYQWFAEGIKLSLFSINYVSTNGSPVVKYVHISSKSIPVGIEHHPVDLETGFRLFPCHPNPCNEKTEIGYFIPRKCHFRISLTNSIGKEVRVLVNVEMEEGFHSFITDMTGFPPGIYFCSLRSSSGTISQKLIVER